MDRTIIVSLFYILKCCYNVLPAFMLFLLIIPPCAKPSTLQGINALPTKMCMYQCMYEYMKPHAQAFPFATLPTINSCFPRSPNLVRMMSRMPATVQAVAPPKKQPTFP